MPLDLRLESPPKKKMPAFTKRSRPWRWALLSVKIKPDGAEVLVDGELMGIPL